ncbi:nucleotidyltransferase family protein [Natrarchaeobius oligotrophus]|uniref:Nucleotidyltransferase family protein n=1 Tax=Natrarchaeobius chitinivorans TaxID=1679083 RepID=A0A3N6MYA9_NATCH|nr:nucleotidyltransferase family protein [Natrarchaeobius chitinivorans]RQH01452.1 nucleotidyltransferase family protein [Natrarchaeobius chitinivorans]
MHALVFAAGRGSRLRPYTDEMPKPLLEVGDEPILGRCLRTVAAAGVDEIVVVVGYRREEVVDAMGESVDGVSITYAVQRDRKGLAHAICKAAEDGFGISLPTDDRSATLSSESSSQPSNSLHPFEAFPDDVMTVNGDNVFDDCDLSKLRARHDESGVDGTLLLDRVSRNDAEATAHLDLADDGTVRSVAASIDDSGAPPMGSEPADASDERYIAAGVQTHHGPSLLEACHRVDRAESGEYELADALEFLVDEKRYVGVELAGWHRNVNTPADLETARRRLDGST